MSKNSTEICEIQDCGRPQRSGGLCKTHYERWLTEGIRGGPIKYKGGPVPAECTKDDCHNPGYCRELCRYHYDQWRAYEQGKGECSVEGCPRSIFSGSLCRGHYDRWLRTGDTGKPSFGREKAPTLKCRVPICINPRSGRSDLCSAHIQRLRDHGDLRENDPIKRKGNIYIDSSSGYAQMGGLAVHRLVMEEKMQRPLFSQETVHHKNGQRADNRPENLELWSSRQPGGQRVVDKLAWALEMLDLYKNTEEMAQAERSYAAQRVLSKTTIRI